jgi:tRNA dimethylallyltransferase
VHLRADRARLVERLDARAAGMWEAGLLDEVRGLMPHGLEQGVTARKAIGYAQALAEIQGRMTRAEAVAATQQLTRTYARRQVGWFRRYADAAVVDADDAAAVGAEIARQATLD